MKKEGRRKILALPLCSLETALAAMGCVRVFEERPGGFAWGLSGE